jgi:hypothetical protein
MRNKRITFFFFFSPYFFSQIFRFNVSFSVYGFDACKEAAYVKLADIKNREMI